jgi:hypothetical protein
VGIAVAVEVGGTGVCVAVSEGVGGIKVSVGETNMEMPRQPISNGNANEQIMKNLDRKCPMGGMVLFMKRMAEKRCF